VSLPNVPEAAPYPRVGCGYRSSKKKQNFFFGKRAQSRKIVVTRRDSFPPLFELCVAAAPSAQKAADLQQSEPVNRYG
jgi:hypothetical protein